MFFKRLNQSKNSSSKQDNSSTIDRIDEVERIMRDRTACFFENYSPLLGVYSCQLSSFSQRSTDQVIHDQTSDSGLRFS